MPRPKARLRLVAGLVEAHPRRSADQRLPSPILWLLLARSVFRRLARPLHGTVAKLANPRAARERIRHACRKLAAFLPHMAEFRSLPIGAAEARRISRQPRWGKLIEEARYGPEPGKPRRARFGRFGRHPVEVPRKRRRIFAGGRQEFAGGRQEHLEHAGPVRFSADAREFRVDPGLGRRVRRSRRIGAGLGIGRIDRRSSARVSHKPNG